jgi:hypothetical protein
LELPRSSHWANAAGAMTTTRPPMRAWSVPQYSAQCSQYSPSRVGVKLMLV